MPLTKTSHVSEFTRPPPSSCTFAFPPKSPTSLSPSTTVPPILITFRPGSTLGTQLHWHTTHTEYIQILQGAALIMISGKTKICTAEDGLVRVPRYARHEWMRFDRPGELLRYDQVEIRDLWMKEHSEEEIARLREMDLVAEEWTDPADGQKEVFFRNLFSTVGEPMYKGTMLGEVWKMLTVMCVMWELDNYVVLLDFGGWKGGWREWVESAVTYAIMGTMMFVGKRLGLRGLNEEYMPKLVVEKREEAKSVQKGE